MIPGVVLEYQSALQGASLPPGFFSFERGNHPDWADMRFGCVGHRASIGICCYILVRRSFICSRTSTLHWCFLNCDSSNTKIAGYIPPEDLRLLRSVQYDRQALLLSAFLVSGIQHRTDARSGIGLSVFSRQLSCRSSVLPGCADTCCISDPPASYV